MNNGSCKCFIVPSRMLRKLKDLDSLILSEHLRGHRTARELTLMSANVTGEKRRTVYDCRHREQTPPRGTLVRSEGAAPVADATVNDAYENSGITYDFYQTILGRNSVDGRGMRLDSFVHYGTDFNNAFWDGAEMTYGDGDNQLFTGFAKALDVVAHELTHGVTQFTVPGGLDYVDQSGALNESISDVFGSVIKQWHFNEDVDTANWLIGEGIMGEGVGKALRSMADPGNTDLTWSEDDQPKNMSGYVPGGDVHTNSGIPNHAFYLAATRFGGYSWEKAGKIWYAALPMLTNTATFADAKTATMNAASNLFGAAERAVIESAWEGVGV